MGGADTHQRVLLHRTRPGEQHPTTTTPHAWPAPPPGPHPPPRPPCRTAPAGAVPPPAHRAAATARQPASQPAPRTVIDCHGGRPVGLGGNERALAQAQPPVLRGLLQRLWHGEGVVVARPLRQEGQDPPLLAHPEQPRHALLRHREDPDRQARGPADRFQRQRVAPPVRSPQPSEVLRAALRRGEPGQHVILLEHVDRRLAQRHRRPAGHPPP